MSQYTYKAVPSGGAPYEGVIDAVDKTAAYREITGRGETVISIKEAKAGTVFGFLGNMFRRIRQHEKILFSRNLGAMIEAGLPLSRALSVLERQSSNSELRRVLGALGGDIGRGKSLSEAMKLYPKVFSSLVISMVGAGEESGKLAESLKIIADQMERSYLLKKKVRGALMYPGIVVSAMVAIGALMLVYVVPTLTSTFKELKVPLPLTTRLVVGLSDFLAHNILLSLGILVILGAGAFFGARTAKGRRFFDFSVLRIPIVGTLIKETNAARTGRTLASLLSSGVDVVMALGITGEVLQNSYYKDVLKQAAGSIEKGLPLSSVFLGYPDLYPVFVGEMIAVGEETGQLSGMLMRIALFYEEEVEQKTKDMSTIIEPFLMVVIGAAVGFFAIAMISPTYSLVNGL